MEQQGGGGNGRSQAGRTGIAEKSSFCLYASAMPFG
jgi:hypothetical protein